MADIVLGVTGGIAAYKAVSLLRELTESGHDVTVVPTASALRFVGEPTWAALSGKPVARELWESPHEVPHVELGQRADLVIVAPATADFLARASHGIASDLLTNVLLTTRGRVVIAPSARGTGLGHELMKEALTACEKYFPQDTIKISAQEHLEKFYNKHGFERVSDMYLEDDIPHIGMIKTS